MKKTNVKNVVDFEKFQLNSKSKKHIIGGIDPNRPTAPVLLDDEFIEDPTDPTWAGPGSGTTSSSITFSTLTNDNDDTVNLPSSPSN
ncbi:conserved hypothetical protein [Flavobacterium sp. 9AF]|uniref:hypothetical protein n=1 Tax=Flavobacterium sp. 9AF TaxID=2653142 RepID=UPI0012F15419|nr:hypothetical protein [Flavobacterium sp. 9AF]VXB41653.1 conserved hypothetical protein [Flavobacterium sp. 9AF]